MKPYPRYPVPDQSAWIEHEVNKSRFLAITRNLGDVTGLKAHLHETRQQHSGANHVVYAFRVGFGSSITEGMSDDGEPAGTAGAPVMAVVRGSGLGDVLILVVRYFGGIKLGTGGLVRAYTEAAQLALAQTTSRLKTHWQQMGVEIDYAGLVRVKDVIAQHEGRITDEAFGERVTLYVLIPVFAVAVFQAQVVDVTRGTAMVIELGTVVE
jgi:uncharacterized YigZ family protein